MEAFKEKTTEGKFDIYSDGPIYCVEQIKIPPNMPDIMKQFTKAAIRTQPPDLLLWSSAYFGALANGEIPPVKEKFEIVIPRAKGLSRGILEILHKQLGSKNKVKVKYIKSKWRDLCLGQDHLRFLLKKSGFNNQNEDIVTWLEFFAVACMSINSTMMDTMTMICEILTEDPKGGPARIPFVLFEHLYCYLAKITGKIPIEQVDSAMNYLAKEADRQDGMIKPRNFFSPDCPPINVLPVSEGVDKLLLDEEVISEEQEEELMTIGSIEESPPPIEETAPTDFGTLFKRRYHRWRKLH